MGIRKFGMAYDDMANKMIRELRAASSKDRKTLTKSSGLVSEVILATAKGDKTVDTLYQKEMVKWVRIIRDRFAGVVIRRSLNSVDSTGKMGLDQICQSESILLMTALINSIGLRTFVNRQKATQR